MGLTNILSLIFSALLVHAGYHLIVEAAVCPAPCTCTVRYDWTSAPAGGGWSDPCITVAVLNASSEKNGCCLIVDPPADVTCFANPCTGKMRLFVIQNNCGCDLVVAPGGANPQMPPALPNGAHVAAGNPSWAFGGGTWSLPCNTTLFLSNAIYCLGALGPFPLGYNSYHFGTHYCENEDCIPVITTDEE